MQKSGPPILREFSQHFSRIVPRRTAIPIRGRTGENIVFGSAEVHVSLAVALVRPRGSYQNQMNPRKHKTKGDHHNHGPQICFDGTPDGWKKASQCWRAEHHASSRQQVDPAVG